MTDVLAGAALEDAADPFSFEPSDPAFFPAIPDESSEGIRQMMREKSLSSLYYLCKVVLGYSKLRPEPHGEMCEFLDFLERERLAGNSSLNRSAFYAPRDSYKTTIATIARSIQRALRDPNTRGLILADIQLHAELFGLEVSNHFKYNELLRWLFREVIPENFNKARWSMSEMCLERTALWRDATFTMAGAFGGIESAHYDWIIPDDLVVEKHLRSDTEMDKLTHWLGGLEPLLVNDVEGWIDLVGSRKKKGDSYEMQEKRFGAGDAAPILLGPHAVKRGGICIYSRQIIEEGKNIFPYRKELKSGISDDYLARMRKHDPQRFWAQLMNSPKGDGLNTLRVEDIGWFRIEPNGDIKCYRDGQLIHKCNVWEMDRRILFDPAKAEKQSNSMQAMHVVAKGSHPFRFVLESHVGHFPADEAIETLFDLSARWSPGIVSIEARGLQGWAKYAIDTICELKGLPYLPIVPWPAEGSPKAQWAKDEHIRGLQPITRAGWLWFEEGLRMGELIDEVEFYPNVRWDDGLDALAQDLDYAPYSEDEEHRAGKVKGEDRMLVQAGFGRPDRSEEWNEEKFLRTLDRTGYGLRIVA